MTMISIDANVLVALVDVCDRWHHASIALRDALLDVNAQLVYFDCVVNEAISVIGRRAEERQRSDQFEHLVDELTTLVPERDITWISPAGHRLYQDVVRLCRRHQGRLNYHDALMALVCQELDIHHIVSFDADFDEIAWLTRISNPAEAHKLPRP